MAAIFRAPQLRVAVASMASLCLLLAQVAPAAATLTAVSPGIALSQLKPGSQFGFEAGRYDAALKAISGIGAAQITTLKELQAAAATLRRYAPDLKFATSRLIALAHADRSFTAAIARYFVNERLAQEFARKIASDPAFVTKLDGAAAVMVRMKEAMAASSGAIRKAEETLRAGMLKVQGKLPARVPAVAAAMTVTTWTSLTAAVLIAAAVTYPAVVAGATIAGSTVTVAAVSAFGAIIPALVYSAIPQGVALTLASFQQAATQTVADAQADADAIAACVEAALERHAQCTSDALQLPLEERIQAQLSCDAYLAAEQAFCPMVAAF